ncbi:MAG: DNA gyrase subunit A, partial [Oscillospiraceae bacterium]
GEIIFNPSEMAEIYRTGRGGFKLRAKWRYMKSENIIEIFEIPYTTTAEAIIDKVAELVKSGKIKDISDMRDETDLGGLKLAIDLKRGVDPDKLMQKLMRMTPLLDTFSCNFNILIAGNPRVMGVREILSEWVAWRTECVRRRVYFDLSKKRDKLHLLNGLKKILLDIDKAIAIIRQTELEAEVVPNLMIGFGIDRIQAEFVAEIRLRNINKEYILKRVEETDKLEKEIAELEEILNSPRKLKKIITDELAQVSKTYPSPRKTAIVFADEIEEADIEDEIPDYPVTLFLSKEGYFKKITPQSLRMSGEQKYKENDVHMQLIEATNRDELLIFTDRQQVYKVRVADFDDAKASVLGVYLPSHLAMDEGENVFCMINPGDYSGNVLLFFQNGKVARL